MGCDIHLYVEKKVKGVWRSAEKWKTEDGSQDVPYEKRVYGGCSRVSHRASGKGGMIWKPC